MKTADLLRMLADSEEELERLREKADRLNREAEKLSRTDRCPNLEVAGNHYCRAHLHMAGMTMAYLSPKPEQERCQARVPLAAGLPEDYPPSQGPASDP